MATMNMLTRSLGRVVNVARPVSEHAIRWALIGLGVFFLFLEIDFVFEGALYHSWRWFWQNVIAVHPTVPYWLGVLSYHLVQRHYRNGTRREYRQTAISTNTGELDLGVKTLQNEADTMGVEVDIASLDREARAKDIK